TAGVEITTGPLGSGLASAVGMAMASRRERGLFDPEAAPGASPFDHSVVVLASDGDLEEGVSGEASSLAGTQELSNLVVIWDDNRISIEDDTAIAFSEDTAARYAAYGWHVQHVDFRAGDEYNEDLNAFHAAMEAAKADSRPSFIRLSTIIAWPAPNAQNTGGSHGSALGDDEIKATKEILGFDPEQKFEVPAEVLNHTRSALDRGRSAHIEWDESYTAWREANPANAELFDRLAKRELPADLDDQFPVFETSDKGIATRAASGQVLNAIAATMPELWGGSADLAGSNNTLIKGDPSFLPEHRSTGAFSGNEYGRNIHFGVREFSAGLIGNGIALHGGTRPYSGTFLVFSDYQRPAIRLAALQQLPNVFVWTHDSIGLGEDGPTHQPIEHLSALRAIPGLDLVRPADANETSVVWRKVLDRTDGPSGLVLTRQAVPVLDREKYALASEAARGGYVLLDTADEPEVAILASGSEVAIAIAAAEELQAAGTAARVISMPCQEWFDAQPADYRAAVLPRGLKARVSIEAASAMSWHKYLGDAGRAVSIEHFGASADYATLYEKFGITPAAVVTAAKESIAAAKADA
ncbi:MAG: transketolase family protein, partial [Brevibacterium aurantiacum]